jgi:hypothetical protein
MMVMIHTMGVGVIRIISRATRNPSQQKPSKNEIKTAVKTTHYSNSAQSWQYILEYSPNFFLSNRSAHESTIRDDSNSPGMVPLASNMCANPATIGKDVLYSPGNDIFPIMRLHKTNQDLHCLK